MSEASFDSYNQSDPNEQGPQNTADSVSQSEARKNSLDEAHMTEIDISEDKDVGNHNYIHSEDDGDEDGDSQAQSKTSGIIRDDGDSETTSSVATEADVKGLTVALFINSALIIESGRHRVWSIWM